MNTYIYHIDFTNKYIFKIKFFTSPSAFWEYGLQLPTETSNTFESFLVTFRAWIYEHNMRSSRESFHACDLLTRA